MDHEAQLAEVSRALAELEAQGARAYDAISCDSARALIERAAKRPPRAAALLAERAAWHLSRLQLRFERERSALERKLSDAERVHGTLLAERAALERGELLAVRRSLRRRGDTPARGGSTSLARRQRCFGEYQAALSDMVAALALARASELVPEQAGPYNPMRIARDLLEGIRAVSPIYLRSQLARLEELSSLLALPDHEPPPAAKKPPPRKPSGAKRRS